MRHSSPGGAWHAFGSVGSAATIALLALLVSTPALSQANDPNRCGDPFRNHFGPWDYRTARPADIEVVESAHFTKRIENLQPGERVLGDDISYALNVFPNHHRALIAITSLADRLKTDRPPSSSYTVECWYERAIRFRPSDTVNRALFAQYLAKRQRKDEALKQLETAVGHAQDNAFSHYNIGLVYHSFGEFDRALAQAHKAIALGFQRPGLADLLRKENKWQEPGN